VVRAEDELLCGQVMKFRSVQSKKGKEVLSAFSNSQCEVKIENVEISLSPLFQMDLDDLTLSSVPSSKKFRSIDYELTISKEMLDIDMSVSTEVLKFFEAEEDSE
jgi:hypothetical protein